MPECPVEPSVPHRIRLNVRISPKYSEYQIFGQKCAEYQILGKTPYIFNFPAHTTIYLSPQRKQILIAVEATTLPTAVHCVLKIQHDIQIILCAKDVMHLMLHAITSLTHKIICRASATSHINK